MTRHVSSAFSKPWRVSKVFFAFHLQNYARLTPVYISQMTKLETSDPETSQFLRENLSVNKTSIPFLKQLDQVMQ